MTDSIDWSDEQQAELYEKLVTSRFEAWESIVRQQFDMVYVGKFTYEDTESMSPHERKTLYAMLFEQKKAEKEAAQKGAITT